MAVDRHGLARELSARVRGEVRFGLGDRALYATDASNYRRVPIGVVVPRDVDDAVEAVAVCREYGAPVLSRGGGTSLAGQCCNVAVVLDWSKHVDRVESVDPHARSAVVQPGVVLDELNRATRRYGGLVFGPKPATHSHCTIGGMLGNDSCGSTAQWSGTTAANTRRLEVLTYDGLRMWVGPTSAEEYAAIQRSGGRRAEVYRRLRALRDRYADEIRARFPDIPRRISGYQLPELFDDHGFNLARALVGTESTCVTILRAELELRPEPRHRALVLLAYPDVVAAAGAVPEINGHAPFTLEGIEDRLAHLADDGPRGGAWLMVEFGGDTSDEARGRARGLLDALRHRTGRLVDDPAEVARLWRVRESALGAAARVPGLPDAWPGWEDSAVRPDNLAGYLRDLRRLMAGHGFGAASLYGHFGHACVHVRLPFDLVTPPGIARFREFVEQAADLCVSYGGSLSGEHGDGQARGELLARMYGPAIVDAFGGFKAIFDPDDRMNPGKVVHARPLDADLRLGPDHRPARPDTAFRYPDDGGRFDRAVLRCVGVGQCRRPHPEGGVMCPSYQVTKEEKHSTRGRSRLLFEMLTARTLTAGWRDGSVADALDLCLACKGCKRDCPVSVDMATYKAEFLYHHWAGRVRPRDHYALGWLPVVARLAGYLPELANAATQAPVLSRLAKAAAGVDQRRRLPRFAAVPFRTWYRRRLGGGPPGPRGDVVLWPDTFSCAFAPNVAASAVEVLAAAGFRVRLPAGTRCCGLTWISTGQLGIARRVLRRTVDALTPALRAGLPVVGLEPSCTAVFRSDAAELLGPDPDVRRLADATVTLAELLRARAPEFAPRLASVDGRPVPALVQRHCHQHAVLGFEADLAVMRAANLDPRVVDSGCCGLAGNFGMTPDHWDVSMACAEQALLPAVRAAGASTLVIADGFSCRTQIEQDGTGRRPVHLAEVLAAAVRGQTVGAYPERALAFRPGDR